jgi:hypothetical protein
MLQSRLIMGTRRFCFRVDNVIKMDKGYSFIKPGKMCQTYAEDLKFLHPGRRISIKKIFFSLAIYNINVKIHRSK